MCISNDDNIEYVRNIRKRTFFKLSVIGAFWKCVLAEKKLICQEFFFFKNATILLYLNTKTA